MNISKGRDKHKDMKHTVTIGHIAEIMLEHVR